MACITFFRETLALRLDSMPQGICGEATNKAAERGNMRLDVTPSNLKKTHEISEQQKAVLEIDGQKIVIQGTVWTPIKADKEEAAS